MKIDKFPTEKELSIELPLSDRLRFIRYTFMKSSKKPELRSYMFEENKDYNFKISEDGLEFWCSNEFRNKFETTDKFNHYILDLAKIPKYESDVRMTFIRSNK